MTPSSAPTASLAPDPDQPRRDPGDLGELREAVLLAGEILQPILVVPNTDAPPDWLIVGGERRWRVARDLGFTEVPIRVVDATKPRALLALAENTGRAPLSLVDQARALQALYRRSGHETIVGFCRDHNLEEARTNRLIRLADLEDGPVAAAMADGYLQCPRAAAAMLSLSKHAQRALLERARATDRPISRTTVADAQQRAQRRAEITEVRLKFTPDQWTALLDRLSLGPAVTPSTVKQALLLRDPS